MRIAAPLHGSCNTEAVLLEPALFPGAQMASSALMRCKGLGLRVQGLGLHGLPSRVAGLGLRVSGFMVLAVAGRGLAVDRGSLVKASSNAVSRPRIPRARQLLRSHGCTDRPMVCCAPGYARVRACDAVLAPFQTSPLAAVHSASAARGHSNSVLALPAPDP